MKRMALLSVALLLVFSLTACESSSPDTYKTQAAEPAPVEETTQSREKTPLPPTFSAEMSGCS